jgi:hypothetical protein
MKTHLKRSRGGKFESLERRQMLAGDVLVSVVHGALKIEGDAADNQVAVAAGAEAGTFVITGLDGTNLHLVDRTTNEIGEAVGELEVAVRGGAKIALGDGNDKLTLTDATFRHGVSVHMGVGNDQVNATATGEVEALRVGTVVGLLGGGARAGGELDLGDGDDEFTATGLHLRGRLAVEAGDGNDSVHLGSELAGGAGVANGDEGTDELPEADLTAHAGLYVDLGDGNDLLDASLIRTRGNLQISAGGGEDSVSVGLTAAHKLLILGGDDADTINVIGSHASRAGIIAGEGDDLVSVADSVFSSLGALLGDGADTLSTANVEAKFALLLGGDGEDTLNELAANNLLHDLIRGFELPLVDDVVENLPLLGSATQNVLNRIDERVDRAIDRLDFDLGDHRADELTDLISGISAGVKGRISISAHL